MCCPAAYKGMCVTLYNTGRNSCAHMCNVMPGLVTKKCIINRLKLPGGMQLLIDKY